MVEHPYAYLLQQKELCPAIYIKLSKLFSETIIAKDVHAYLDTGAELTAVPIEFKPRDFDLIPSRFTTIIWWGFQDAVPVFSVRVTANGYKPRTIEVFFDKLHDYGIIGRNLMRYWYLTLKGPDSCFEINE